MATDEEFNAVSQLMTTATKALEKSVELLLELEELRKTALSQVLQIMSDDGTILMAQGIDPTTDRRWRQLDELKALLEDR